jgi:signal transduction histidine kinase
VRRLEGLVERLLSLSRLETGRHEFKFKPTPIRAVIDEAVASLSAASLANPARLTVNFDQAADVEVLGDSAALAQSLSNLLINAWKYTPDQDKQIRLEVKSRERFIDITVADNGPGIPRQERRLIFGQFERGRFAIDSNRSGSGLGLAIAKAIVEAHRGRLELRSRPGAGAEFRMRLRRHHAKEAGALAA